MFVPDFYGPCGGYTKKRAQRVHLFPAVCDKISAMHGPQAFQAPQNREHWCSDGGGGSLTKIDVANYCWSIELPAKWRHGFKVGVDGTTYHWIRPPSGWKYSRVVCQKVV